MGTKAKSWEKIKTGRREHTDNGGKGLWKRV